VLTFSASAARRKSRMPDRSDVAPLSDIRNASRTKVTHEC
jgi:hypothetical protein